MPGRHNATNACSGPCTSLERFLAHIEHADSGCWVWTGSISTTGYGRYKNYQAHRVTYELWVGPIPEGLQIDHLCRNTRCVNPEHLEPVTPAVNVQRGWDANRRTHCKRGHDLDDAYIGKGGRRMCRPCALDRAARNRKQAA